MGRPTGTSNGTGSSRSAGSTTRPPRNGHRAAHVTDATCKARYATLLAAAMIVFGSETTAAGPQNLHVLSAARAAQSPTPSRSPIPTTDLSHTRTPHPAPERRPLDDAPLSTPLKDGDQRVIERAASPEDTLPATGTIVPLARPVVVLYGDSLAWEARHFFELALTDQPVKVVTRTFGGTAICDWHDEMADDATTLRPGLVIIEFVGNNFTPCMQDATGQPLAGAALVDNYANDAATAIATFAPIDAQVVFAGAPISSPAMTSLDLHRAPLNEVYEQLGRHFERVRYVDAGSAVLDDGAWTATLTCLPSEPCPNERDETGTAVNVVRAPDGLHFCPANAAADRGVTGDCPVWSSGAFRFGTELARPVMESLAA
jgi:hypothetical protein